MKALVFCQLQHDIPECFWASVKKAREMWAGDIWLICPRRELGYAKQKEHGVKCVARESLKSPLIEAYEKNTFLLSMYPDWDGFWDNACRRFPYIAALMEREDILEIFHVENDVAVYLDVEKMFAACESQYGVQIVFSPHEPHHLNCGFMYCGSLAAIKLFCEQIVEYFKRGPAWFKENYPQDPIINETLFTYVFRHENPIWVGLFPTMPHDKEYKGLGFLIDPDGWGRWVDGVRYEPGKPYAADCHYIGHEILAGRYDVGWHTLVARAPYVIDKITGKLYPLATLHFNSKQVGKWV
jgi:hypothetical protein